MDLRVETVTGKSKEKQKTKEIYTSSFLKEDRMPFWLMLIMAKMKNTEFISFHDKQTLCGFVYMATIKNLTFIMFLAVDENIRSKGYGSRILEKIQSLHTDNKIIISIERCVKDAKDIKQRLRRKKFYANNGYIETGYLVELANKKQEILIKNGQFDEDEFYLFFKKYSNGTMKPKLWRIGS
ncbi:GNAT family N-acetyltransferase [Sedimentibacter sp. zth1]|uniref:GNAT family N-acetyltransferase n=1 Tax=Sedimentibacter sp. zth1 TaxID=2816908 RepID=UPI001A916733|nr:GNAT family N-acetyltransferase [Sedimentibacter sp. zth1]QSX04654.1 GNAT family N-acetyltransferase [Sedimentibacter sp. zth1]